MTSRFPIPLPRSTDGSLLPALLAAALALALAIQLFASTTPELPEAGVVPHVAVPAERMPAPVIIPPILERRAIFTPQRMDSAASGVPQGPLGGTAVTGSISVGNRSVAILQTPKGGVIRLAPGQGYGGWTLVAITPTGARFRRGGETMTMTYGAAALPAAEAAPSEDDSR